MMRYFCRTVTGGSHLLDMIVIKIVSYSMYISNLMLIVEFFYVILMSGINGIRCD